MLLELFTTFIIVAGILAYRKHRAFTWSYRSSTYIVHCLILIKKCSIIILTTQAKLHALDRSTWDTDFVTSVSRQCGFQLGAI